jgi:hypothetical protein
LYPLNIFDRAHLYTQLLSSCHINLFYYASFAYLMLQRYTDAGRCEKSGLGCALWPVGAVTVADMWMTHTHARTRVSHTHAHTHTHSDVVSWDVMLRNHTMLCPERPSQRAHMWELIC